jgi:hypothetical protein
MQVTQCSHRFCKSCIEMILSRRFSTIEHLKDHVCKELRSVPRRTLLDVGYFEGRQSQKVWIVSEKYLDAMYSKPDSEILLWVEIVEHHDSDDSDE